MKRILYIGLLIVVVMMGCNKRECDFLSPIDSQDAEYTALLDSVESAVSDAKCGHFSDTIIRPAMAFYEEGNSCRHLWMQARCHYILGNLLYGQDKLEQATEQLIQALNLLDANFEATQAPVGRLYSKIHFVTSRIAYLFSDEQCSTQLGRLGLDHATAVGDTSWMLRLMANLSKLYERFGKPGEGETAYLYCDGGLAITDAQRYPYETAMLENALANSLRHSHQYDSALLHFEHAGELIDSTCFLYYRNYLEKAFVYYKQKDYASAVVYFEKAFGSGDENIKSQSAFGLADCYEEMGDTLRAMPYYNLVKTHQEKQVVMANHNGEAMPMLNAYLNDVTTPKNRDARLWVAVMGLLLLVAIVTVAFKRRKKDHVSFAQSWAQFEQSDIFLRIRERLAADGGKISSKNVDDFSNLALGQADFVALKDAVDAAFGGFASRLAERYPDLSPADLNACCLALTGISHAEMAVLQGVKYNSFTNRISKIKKILGTEENLSAYLKKLLKEG